MRCDTFHCYWYSSVSPSSSYLPLWRVTYCKYTLSPTFELQQCSFHCYRLQLAPWAAPAHSPGLLLLRPVLYLPCKPCCKGHRMCSILYCCLFSSPKQLYMMIDPSLTFYLTLYLVTRTWCLRKLIPSKVFFIFKIL